MSLLTMLLLTTDTDLQQHVSVDDVTSNHGGTARCPSRHQQNVKTHNARSGREISVTRAASDKCLQQNLQTKLPHYCQLLQRQSAL